MSRALSLAGFQVTIIGRFWVIPEDLLRPYEIRTQNVRTGVGTEVKKAYKKDSFKDAWERYLSPAVLPPLVSPWTAANTPNSEDVNTSGPSPDEGDFVTSEIDQNGDITAVHGF
jgi:hypothetical protein